MTSISLPTIEAKIKIFNFTIDASKQKRNTTGYSTEVHKQKLNELIKAMECRMSELLKNKDIENAEKLNKLIGVAIDVYNK